MNRRPLLGFTVCWIAGSAAGCLFSGRSLLLYLAGCLLLPAIWAASGSIRWRAAAVFGLALAAAAVYWEWNEAGNVSRLPELLGQPASELNEAYVTAAGVIVSPVERDGDRVDFTVKLSRADLHRQGEEEGQEAASAAAAVTGAGTTAGAQAGAETHAQAAAELVAVQIKLQEENEILAAAEWQRGDRVVIEGELEQPQGARNFGSFDYRAYLLTQQIHWLLKGSGAASVKAEPPAALQPAVILRWNDRARAVLGAEMDRLFREPHAGYMKGLVIGIQELDPETFRQFSQLGLTHILAISGMHVAVYVGVILFLLRRCRVTRETALTITLLLVPVYVLLSGAGPSVVRAGLMSMIALLAARLRLLKDGMNILAAAALFMLVWNPYLLLSVSFQLSFLVTAGLMVYTPLAAPLFKRLPGWLGSTFSVTLIAQLVSFPLTIYYFNQFSLLSFAANLLLVPFITFLVLPLGTLALLLGRFWAAGAKVTVQLAELLNNATFAAVKWVNGYSGGVTIWAAPSLLWICLYYGLLYGLLLALQRRAEEELAPRYMEDETRPLLELEQPGNDRRKTGIPAGLGSLVHSASSPAIPAVVKRSGAPLAYMAFPGRGANRWSNRAALLCLAGIAFLLYNGYNAEDLKGAGVISYLDIGQGDSILITTPAGAHLLVDGGGTLSFGNKEEWRIRRSPYEVGAKTLLPLLKRRGIHRLDAVILTHGDQDHAGGLQAVLEGMPVSALLFNGTLADSEPYAKLMQTALAAGIRLYPVQQGMVLAPDKATRLHFLWPEQAADGQALPAEVEDQNHQSVVFRLEMNSRNFLFTGDMDIAAEEAIMDSAHRSGIRAGQPIDVLKAAHHGSKTATGADWLSFWHPAAAVISAGVNNLYGHPHGDVLERLKDSGTVVYRTDGQGEIQLKVREDGITVRYKLGTE
ncbi:ComEC/Rec2 family competence protein [Paenibacillus sp. MMS20-IR301]|uniref:ComEC/Rec2 family competence protein n=1 Tax=Paenibacillus sp. MMS20-IR301 TaxID=2895946 RepID=UPI0028E68727|nr:ComEC/Rec2 family competence protein [Paenibacillus sp. MMS20-IR301]WNS43696.1 ComEC/Rec2 family competence protein [Paenibacillus sp. MMS20-IR301]